MFPQRAIRVALPKVKKVLPQIFGLTCIISVGVVYNNPPAVVHKKADKEDAILAILQKKPDGRSLQERLDVFDYVLEKGLAAIEKAQGKNVVILLGETGGGKSTLMNYLWGCTLHEQDGAIEVSPTSPRKQIAPIGNKKDSCTLTPTCVPDFRFSVHDFFSESDFELMKDEYVTFVDLPGLNDTRGVEIALANAVVLRQLIVAAKSTRIVQVEEKRHLFGAGKGAAWRNSVKVLESRFKMLARDNRSIYLIVTKSPNKPLAAIEQEVKACGEADGSNFYECYHFATYNPLMPAHRKDLLSGIANTRAYVNLQPNVCLSDAELGQTTTLVQAVREEIASDLAQPEGEHVKDSTLRDVRFTYHLSLLGNPTLASLHKVTEQAVQGHAETHLRSMNPNNNLFSTQYAAWERYEAEKNVFQEYVSFTALDEVVESMKLQTQDPRGIVAMNDPQVCLASGAMSGYLMILAYSGFSAPFTIPLSLGFAYFSVQCFHRYWNPTVQEKQAALFFADRRKPLWTFIHRLSLLLQI